MILTLNNIQQAHLAQQQEIAALRAENATLKKKDSASQMLVKSLEAQKSIHLQHRARYEEATKTMQSERDANSLLTDEVEQLKAHLAVAREALGLVSKAAPSQLECNQLHHPKKDRHTFAEGCRPRNRYIIAMRKVGEALATIKGDSNDRHR